MKRCFGIFRVLHIKLFSLKKVCDLGSFSSYLPCGTEGRATEDLGIALPQTLFLPLMPWTPPFPFFLLWSSSPWRCLAAFPAGGDTCLSILSVVFPVCSQRKATKAEGWQSRDLGPYYLGCITNQLCDLGQVLLAPLPDGFFHQWSRKEMTLKELLNSDICDSNKHRM